MSHGVHGTKVLTFTKHTRVIPCPRPSSLLLDSNLADARYPGGGYRRSRAPGGELEAVFVQRKHAVFGDPARPGFTTLLDNNLWLRRNAP